MLLGALRSIWQREEKVTKPFQPCFDVDIVGAHFFQESLLQRHMVLVKPLKKFQKIQGIGCLKSAVNKMQEGFSVRFRVVEDEVVGRIIHQPKQFIGLVDDGLSLPPSEHGRPKCRDFDVLQFRETVRNANRVTLNEIGLIEPLHAVVEEYFQVGWWHNQDKVGDVLKKTAILVQFFKKKVNFATAKRTSKNYQRPSQQIK